MALRAVTIKELLLWQRSDISGFLRRLRVPRKLTALVLSLVQRRLQNSFVNKKLADVVGVGKDEDEL